VPDVDEVAQLLTEARVAAAAADPESPRLSPSAADPESPRLSPSAAAARSEAASREERVDEAPRPIAASAPLEGAV